MLLDAGEKVRRLAMREYQRRLLSAHMFSAPCGVFSNGGDTGEKIRQQLLTYADSSCSGWEFRATVQLLPILIFQSGFAWKMPARKK